MLTGGRDRLARSLASGGVLASVSQLVEGRAANVECYPANHRQKESCNDAHTVVTCSERQAESAWCRTKASAYCPFHTHARPLLGLTLMQQSVNVKCSEQLCRCSAEGWCGGLVPACTAPAHPLFCDTLQGLTCSSLPQPSNGAIHPQGITCAAHRE